jgi:hypothetical protein
MTLSKLLQGGKLPPSVHGIAGRIRVDRPLAVEVGTGAGHLGSWIPAERRIMVRSTLTRDVAWLTFWHELCHSWLDDTGASNLFTPRQQEVIADAIATGLVGLSHPAKGDA